MNLLTSSQMHIRKKLKIGRYYLLFRNNVNFIPTHRPIIESDVYKLKEFLVNNKDILVLTGAGISTESGVPDYRSKEVGLYARTDHKPITYQEFIKNTVDRRRYWARSFIGWPRFSSTLPNRTHQVLAKFETNAIISGIVTQNVDNLHFKAGSRNVIELHGNLFKVICISCHGYVIERDIFQEKMRELNPAMNKTSRMLRPDGDVELSEEDVNSFIVPSCPLCSGYLKPDVIFFGENIPAYRNDEIKCRVDQCDALLVIGSSLSVYSAFRIILQAIELRKPVYIINIGQTRADDIISFKIEANCGEILTAVSHLIP